VKITAITCTSDTKQAIIADALRSAPWVDENLIVHLTGGGNDRTLEIARSVVGDKLRILEIPLAGAESDMAHFRNLGLEHASGDWAILLDTDERILANGIDVRSTLERQPANVACITIYDDLGTYDKIRFIRLPTKGRYQQGFGIHEDFAGFDGIIGKLPHIRFHELPKTPEQVQASLKAQLVGMQKQVASDPTNPRWRYYLGSIYENLQQYPEAIAEYKASVPYVEDPGIRAWTYYSMGRVAYANQSGIEAIDYSLEGMKYRPDYAELPWLASVVYQSLGELEKALAWAKITALWTWRGKREDQINRVSFKEPRAYFEGPYEVMARVYHDLKDGREQWATKELMRARKERELFFRGVSA
jgi:tetratricopeptide (TPR) repeat protein